MDHETGTSADERLGRSRARSMRLWVTLRRWNMGCGC